MKLNKKLKKAIYDWGLGVAAAAITLAVASVTDLAPEYAVVIGALAAPAIKWADKNKTDYGRNAE